MEKSERDRFVEIGKMVEELSEYAKKSQKSAKSSWKEDGSIVTNVDLEISETIRREIAKLFPDDNVVTEEELTEWKPDAKWNFILDPIDGTEVFYSGLPSFCTALGILDGKLNPVGAFIAAPRFGIGEEKLIGMHLNDSKVPLSSHKDRHESLGEGLIGIEPFLHLMHDERLEGKPLVLETPNEEKWAEEIRILLEEGKK